MYNSNAYEEVTEEAFLDRCVQFRNSYWSEDGKDLVFNAYDPAPPSKDPMAPEVGLNEREIGRITYQHDNPMRRWYLRNDVKPWSFIPLKQSEKKLDDVFVNREKEIYLTLVEKEIKTYREPHKMQRSRNHDLEPFVTVASIHIPLAFCAVFGRTGRTDR